MILQFAGPLLRVSSVYSPLVLVTPQLLEMLGATVSHLLAALAAVLLREVLQYTDTVDSVDTSVDSVDSVDTSVDTTQCLAPLQPPVLHSLLLEAGSDKATHHG